MICWASWKTRSLGLESLHRCSEEEGHKSLHKCCCGALTEVATAPEPRPRHSCRSCVSVNPWWWRLKITAGTCIAALFVMLGVIPESVWWLEEAPLVPWLCVALLFFRWFRVHKTSEMYLTWVPRDAPHKDIKMIVQRRHGTSGEVGWQ